MALHTLTRLPTRRLAQAMKLLGVAYLAGIRLAVADPALDGMHRCQGASPQEAVAVADMLYERGDYQRAGVCYQTAGDLERANLAFMKATAPKGEATAHAVASQGDTAKVLFQSVQRAFRPGH
jgi:hypothetical protein